MKDINRAIVRFLLVGLFFLIVSSSSAQVSNNYIYGKVFTTDGSSFEGFIKFGKRSFLWSDFYKLEKIDNPYSDYIPENKRKIRNKRIEDEFGAVRIVNRNPRRPTIHRFSIRFGYIKSIDFSGRKDVTLEIKGDKYINLESSYSHRNLSVSVTDIEFGEVKLRADDIDKIELMSRPVDLKISRAQPIYGTVVAEQGEFTGFICWDNDEVDGDDLLDGTWKRRDVSVLFRNIKSIVKEGRCCKVTTSSGKQIELCGSNDVDSGNRGVFVNMPNVGRVKVNWRDFKSINIIQQLYDVGLSYDDYKAANRMSATVTLKNNKEHSGVLVYDLDEAMDIEVLDGKNGNLEYQIPFMYIKSITPRGFDYSRVELRNGAKLSLGDSSDVDYKNSGILLFTGGEDTEFFYWYEVKKIEFK